VEEDVWLSDVVEEEEDEQLREETVDGDSDVGVDVLDNGVEGEDNLKEVMEIDREAEEGDRLDWLILWGSSPVSPAVVRLITISWSWLPSGVRTERVTDSAAAEEDEEEEDQNPESQKSFWRDREEDEEERGVVTRVLELLDPLLWLEEEEQFLVKEGLKEYMVLDSSTLKGVSSLSRRSSGVAGGWPTMFSCITDPDIGVVDADGEDVAVDEVADRSATVWSLSRNLISMW